MAEDRIPVLEGEVDALREERETLLTRIAELEAERDATKRELHLGYETLKTHDRHRIEAEAEVARLREERDQAHRFMGYRTFDGERTEREIFEEWLARGAPPARGGQ